jgi:NADH dehydrogenase/NADH:ubiquinone oxidoreductase subunit G
VLPVTTFAEENGTFIDHSGKRRNIHQAVQASGGTLPSWQILCRIAQKLEVPGFDYENVEQIRAEMDALGTAEPVQDWIQPEGFEYPVSRIDDHVYMGFPLRTWVAGFRFLYPEPVVNNA